jgi:amidophosphoribosyltransferase
MCGIAGAFNVPDASYHVSLMLKTMQHRGQDAAGIVSRDGEKVHEFRGLGLMDEVFGRVDVRSALPGGMAVGHLRYSTTGDARCKENVQPIVCKLRQGVLAIAHNGNLTNYKELRGGLEEQGSVFHSTSDTELFHHLITRSRERELEDAVAEACLAAKGAFSLLIMAKDRLFAAIDPFGFRPLAAVRYGDGWLFASETCALDIFDADEPLTLKAGTIVEMSCKGLETRVYAQAPCRRHCSFEHIYFSRPDSVVFGTLSDDVRDRLGRSLAAKDRLRPDLVSSVPDSSNAMALAYAKEAGVPFEFVLMRNHYMGRTFITPQQTAREHGVRMKLGVVGNKVRGKRVVLVDDSLVRGTTAKKLVGLLRRAGAEEVHMRIASPPVIHPCWWGIDTPDRDELAAARMPIPELEKHLGVDSLLYLTVAELRQALGDQDGDRYCVACFSAEHPTADQLVVPLRRRKPDDTA